MRRYVAYFGQKLHTTASRRRCAGRRYVYVDGMMLLAKATEVDGVIEPYCIDQPGEKSGT